MLRSGCWSSAEGDSRDAEGREHKRRMRRAREQRVQQGRAARRVNQIANERKRANEREERQEARDDRSESEWGKRCGIQDVCRESTADGEMRNDEGGSREAREVQLPASDRTTVLAEAARPTRVQQAPPSLSTNHALRTSFVFQEQGEAEKERQGMRRGNEETQKQRGTGRSDAMPA